MSTTTTPCPTGAEPEVYGVICPLVCACNAGGPLKQQCVSSGLRALDKQLAFHSPVKPEVNYDMTKAPPRPIMSRTNPLQPTDYLPARLDEIPGFRPGVGMVRRPDAIVVKNPALPPTQDNIKAVVEIKFPPDRASEQQTAAYERIAGSPDKLMVLTPDDCKCAKPEPKPEPVAIPKPGPVEVALLALALAALVADDLLPTGATQADDALIPGILLRLGMAF